MRLLAGENTENGPSLPQGFANAIAEMVKAPNAGAFWL